MAILSSTTEFKPSNGMAQPESDVADVAAKSIKKQPAEKEPEEGMTYAEALAAQIDDNNLARDLDASTLATIADLVLREYDIDENSRSKWKEEAEAALKFATQDTEPKQYPWPRASNIIYPLITSASLQFGARAYPAIIQNRNVAKGVVWGSDDGTPATQTGNKGDAPVIDPESQDIQWLIAPGEKEKRAIKVGEHMSWQLLEEMPEWEAQTDQLLHQLPIVGGAVRKTYWNFVEERNCSVLVPLMNIVWNRHAPSFEKAPRITEILSLYPHEVREKELADETFIPVVYNVGDDAAENGMEQSGEDSEAPKIFLEQHRRYDLDGDGYAEPYIITVHKASRQVVRIVASYEKEGIKADEKGDVLRVDAVEYYTLYPFLPDLEGGSYPLGFGHLLKPMNEAINTTLNQMFDSGHLQIAGGGFIGTGLSLTAGPTAFRLGEYIPVNNKGGNIRDSVFPIPFPGPSNVLFELLGFLVSAAEKTASIQDILTGESAKLSETQPTTLLALIEQGMKVYTAIYKRIYRALKGELAKIYRLNRLYLDLDARYKAGDEWKEISRDDYRLGGGVEPIADPTMVTDMQKLARAGVIMPFANDPMFNPMEVRKRYLQAADIPGIDKLLVPPPDPTNSPQYQLEMALKQAELGKSRAQELQFQSAAFLNMANAKAIAGEAQMGWIDKQLEMMRLHIESVNSQVAAASIDVQMEGHKTRERVADKQLEAAKAKAAATGSKKKTSVKARADGGPVSEDEDYLVGERGPEVLVPESGKPYVIGKDGPEVITAEDDGHVIPNMSDKYNTPLSAVDQPGYQAWLKTLPEGMDKTGANYDLQGAYKAGITTSENGHLIDAYKKPNHPTFSNESQYSGKDGHKGGEWVDLNNGSWAYVPSKTNLKMHSEQGLHKYFKEYEPDSTLMLGD